MTAEHAKQSATKANSREFRSRVMLILPREHDIDHEDTEVEYVCYDRGDSQPEKILHHLPLGDQLRTTIWQSFLLLGCRVV